MKALNIIGIVLAPVLFFVSAYYIVECVQASWNEFYMQTDDSFYFGPSRKDVTVEAGVVSLLFTTFYGLVNLYNIMKVKTQTSKIMGIIGVCLTGLLSMLNFWILIKPGHASYDESGVAWTLFSVIMLGFCIVYLVQCTNATKPRRIYNPETIDDLDEII